MAADLGLEVTLIDPEKNPGGVAFTGAAYRPRRYSTPHG
jgi:hypothetical protein